MYDFIIICCLIGSVAYWSNECDKYDAHWVFRYAGCFCLGFVAAFFLTL